MKTVIGAIGVVWLGSFVAGEQIWVHRQASPIGSSAAKITAQSESAPREVTGAPPVEGSDSSAPDVDLLGNEVEQAIADYRIDRGGAVYERHSPETAVPRLGSPTS